MLLLSHEDVVKVLDMSKSVEVLEQAYAEHARGNTTDSPAVNLLSDTSLEEAGSALGLTRDEVAAGLGDDAAGLGGSLTYTLHTFCGLLPSAGVGAVRLTSKVIGYPITNGQKRKVEVPLCTGFQKCALLLLFSTRNGEPLAMIQEDYLQSTRVAATGAVATKHLARPDATVLGLIGAGEQAEKAYLATAAVRDLKQVWVYSLRPESRTRFAEKMQRKTGIPTVALGSGEDVVRRADIVITATSAQEPVIKGEWLRTGTHFTRINHKEFGPDVLERAEVVVTTWRGVDNRLFHEYMVPNAEGKISPTYRGARMGTQNTAELGDLIVGKFPGRTSPQQLTFHDNSANGMGWAALGAYVLRMAKAYGLGFEVPHQYVLQPQY